MASLRETKKQATRQAIADSTARIILDDGVDELTVSRVADEAGISARTFHNYFSDLHEALLVFTETSISAAADDLAALSDEYSTVDAAEKLFSDAVEDTTARLHSLSSLLLVADRVKRMGRSPQNEPRQMERLLEPLVREFGRRSHLDSPVESRILFAACSSVGAAAISEYYKLPEPRDPEQGREIVRTAFKVLRTTS